MDDEKDDEEGGEELGGRGVQPHHEVEDGQEDGRLKDKQRQVDDLDNQRDWLSNSQKIISLKGDLWTSYKNYFQFLAV